MKIYFDYKTKLFSQDEVDTLLTALHGSIMNRIKIIKKRIIFSFKSISDYRLVIIMNKYVYIIGLGGFKKELREDSYYSYFMTTEKKECKPQ
jgi:hypothetical protein